MSIVYSHAVGHEWRKCYRLAPNVSDGTVLTHQKEYDGRLSFAVDAWSSPNYKAFVAITVHLMHDGEPLRLVLDVIELAKAHTGRNMAEAFTQVVEAFGIAKKVCY
jgi:hypothetical protein